MKKLNVAAVGLAVCLFALTAPANAQLLSIGFGGSSGYYYPDYAYTYPAYSYPAYTYPAYTYPAYTYPVAAYPAPVYTYPAYSYYYYPATTYYTGGSGLSLNLF